MNIVNSNREDLSKILELYQIATKFMKSKNQVAWPVFQESLITKEIEANKQWKLLFEKEIACIWATTFEDELIWGSDDKSPAVYIHRIATDPKFRGRNLVGKIVLWAEEYCCLNQLKFVRLDTVGINQGLIKHYQSNGFSFLGTKELKNTEGLPNHYSQGPVCLFQKEILNEATQNF